VRRREFITLLGGLAAWPLVARAQRSAIPLIGFLHGGSRGSYQHVVDAFQRGLKEAGFAAGQNVTVEYRWAEGRYDRLPQLATDLVDRKVAVITTMGNAATFAAKAVTGTIPIIFSLGDDPVTLGLVASLNRPDSNMTGVSQLTSGTGSKRLEILHELVPTVVSVAVIANPNNPSSVTDVRDLEDAARALGVRLHVVNVTSEDEFDAAFTTIIKQGSGALLTGSDQVFTNRRDRLVALAARHLIPTIYHYREFVDAGGLISYGISIADAQRQTGVYTGRILKGEKLVDLPVMQSTKFEFVINLKAAKALGITVPASLLARADEAIE